MDPNSNWSVLVVLFVFISVNSEVLGQDPTCYCLQEEISTLRNPVHMQATKVAGSDVFLIAEQIGVIQQYSLNSKQTTPYIDVTDRITIEMKRYDENGLLGFVLHPQFEKNKKVYLYTMRHMFGKNYAVISEITDQDVAHETLLLLVEQKGERQNGGQLLFGDDGYLYIFIGDGGPDNIQQADSQDGNSLRGKILRVDVDKTLVQDNRLQHYGIPDDNPKTDGWRPEIYAIGISNMWRCSVDKGAAGGAGKGRIFCGDLGSNIADEINLITKASNYGWPVKEGVTCLNDSACKTTTGLTEPIYAFYRNTSGISVLVGGPLYRGKLFPDFVGHLVYGDFVSGVVYSLAEGRNGRWLPGNFTLCDRSTCGCRNRASRRNHLLSFGEDKDGEILLLMEDEVHPAEPDGSLFRLVPSERRVVTCGATYISPSFLIYTLAIVVFVMYRSV